MLYCKKIPVFLLMAALCASLLIIPAKAAAPSPLIWLKFDGNLTDSSGNGHDGIATGNITYVAGPMGQAAYFNDAFINFTGTENTNIKNNTATISFWMKCQKIDKPNRMFLRKPNADNPTYSSFDMYMLGGNNVQVGYEGNYGTDFRTTSRIYTSNAAAYPWDTWDYVTMVMDYDHIYTYVNGVLSKNSTVTIDVASDFNKTGKSADTLASKALLQFGYNQNKDQKMSNTMIDDFRFYDVALSADSVMSIYNDGSKPAYTGASDWAKPELDKAASYGLIPDVLRGQDMTKSITRAEFAAVAVKLYENLSGKTAPAVNINPFTDTNDPEVLKAFTLDIVGGVGDGKFDPGALLNREQAAAMLTRVYKEVYWAGWTLKDDATYTAHTLDYMGVTPFADNDNISAWAQPSVYFMVKHKIINGIGNNKFAPKNTTSAEVATGYANATRETALIIASRVVENLK